MENQRTEDHPRPGDLYAWVSSDSLAKELSLVIELQKDKVISLVQQYGKNNWKRSSLNRVFYKEEKSSYQILGAFVRVRGEGEK